MNTPSESIWEAYMNSMSNAPKQDPNKHEAWAIVTKDSGDFDVVAVNTLPEESSLRKGYNAIQWTTNKSVRLVDIIPDGTKVMVMTSKEHGSFVVCHKGITRDQAYQAAEWYFDGKTITPSEHYQKYEAHTRSKWFSYIDYEVSILSQAQYNSLKKKWIAQGGTEETRSFDSMKVMVVHHQHNMIVKFPQVQTIQWASVACERFETSRADVAAEAKRGDFEGVKFDFTPANVKRFFDKEKSPDDKIVIYTEKEGINVYLGSHESLQRNSDERTEEPGNEFGLDYGEFGGSGNQDHKTTYDDSYMSFYLMYNPTTKLLTYCHEEQEGGLSPAGMSQGEWEKNEDQGIYGRKVQPGMTFTVEAEGRHVQ